MNKFEKKSSESRHTHLLKTLETYQQSVDIWGHGVSNREIADSILEKGLRTKWNAIHDIACRIPENQDSLLHKLDGWDYGGRTIIILIAVPKGFDSSDFGGYSARERSIKASSEHIFSKTEDSNVISPENIIGFINTDTSEFIANPKFSDKHSIKK
ncbi:MAG: hypothetical protein WC473_00420 [Patescibacteria group bacterium]